MSTIEDTPTGARPIFTRWSGDKDSTYENMQIGEELGPIQVTVSEELVKQYAFCMDDYRNFPGSREARWSHCAHAALLANDLLTVYYSNYDRSTVTGLHTEEQLWFRRPVPIGETVTVTGRFTDKYVRRGNGYVVMEAEACDQAGNVLLQHQGIEIMRVHPGGVVNRSSAAPSDPITPEVESGIEPVAEAQRGLTAGTPVAPVTKHLSQEQISVYSFAGEYEKNFHNDLDLARDGGMDGTIAQGLQTAGYFSGLCTDFFGNDWFTAGWLKTKFIKTVYPDSTLTVSGKVAGYDDTDAGQRLRLHLWVRDQNDRLVAVGWASGPSGQ